MSVYKKIITYEFEIRGNGFSLEPHSFGDGPCRLAAIEELRKNGQEDCHQFGVISRIGDLWSWDEGSSSFDNYGNIDSDEIIDFINDHPPQFDQENYAHE